MDRFIHKINEITKKRDGYIGDKRLEIERKKNQGIINSRQAEMLTDEVIKNGLDEYLCDFIRIRADIVCSNNMGFVSDYDHDFKYIKQKDIDGNSRYVYVFNNKVDDIVNQYSHARALCYNIESYADSQSGEIRNFNTNVPNNYDNIIIENINYETLRALDACVAKGFQDPAIRMLRLMSEPRLNGGYEDCSILNTLDIEQLKKYLRKITINYAKKYVYKDSASFLEEYVNKLSINENEKSEIIAYKLAERETKPEYLFKKIESGKFGPELDCSFIEELKCLFNHVVISMKDSNKVDRISRLKEMDCM